MSRDYTVKDLRRELANCPHDTPVIVRMIADNKVYSIHAIQYLDGGLTIWPATVERDAEVTDE